jgi:hypothetical protein
MIAGRDFWNISGRREGARERFGLFAAFRPDLVNALEDGGGDDRG